MHNISIRLILLFLALSSTLQAADSFSNLYVFGDSLSDNGNRIALLPELDHISLAGYSFPEPYFENRYSNGLVAVEHLASLMGIELKGYFATLGRTADAGNNFAVAGAKARQTKSSKIDLTDQVSTFLTSQNYAAPNNALYIIFIGGNDIRDAREQLLSENLLSEYTAQLQNSFTIAAYSLEERFPSSKMQEILEDAIESIEINIRDLINQGARNFLVVNAPDISQTPETISLNENHPGILAVTKDASIWFNINLNEIISNIRADYKDSEINDIKLAEFDLATFMQPFINDTNNGLVYNFKFVNEGCINADYSSLTFDVNSECGDNVDQYKYIDNHFYFDQIHPSAKAHERLGRGLYSFIPEAGKITEDNNSQQP